ncbi:methyltransferase family protein [Haloactinopolyspora alba]|uniref:Methyltransferase family protein n=1 Tax=Haloactinopolyspora alba TaxID=648780 RepID=A0A2P8E3M8_9ACTN|nr:methyltransferase family protein [Haloactinopolyspora alba]
MGYFAGVLVPDSRSRATLGRSARLFSAFLTEQSNPDNFYEILAGDSVDQLSEFVELPDALVLDVGGGPGYFRRAFRAAGARYVSVDSDVGELAARGSPEPGSVVGSGMALPVRDDAVDVCYSSNVLEHVPRPWAMADEMLRVTRPGGVVFLSFTVWWSPWGGHETAPWHLLGGERAARRYERRTGHPPKNRYGRSLFPVTVRDTLAWARRSPRGQLVRALPRYHPWWAAAVVRVPGVRELVTWNLAVVMRRR